MMDMIVAEKAARTLEIQRKEELINNTLEAKCI